MIPKKPLKPGTVISWHNLKRTVVYYRDKDDITVADENNITFRWSWDEGGIECKIVSEPKTRYYVKHIEGAVANGWPVCDRNIKNGKCVVCRATTRRIAYTIAKALNKGEQEEQE
jgi:hypothetical protein